MIVNKRLLPIRSSCWRKSASSATWVGSPVRMSTYANRRTALFSSFSRSMSKPVMRAKATKKRPRIPQLVGGRGKLSTTLSGIQGPITTAAAPAVNRAPGHAKQHRAEYDRY